MRTERLLRNSATHRRLGRPQVKSDLEFNFVLGDRIACMNPTHWDELAEDKSLLLSRAVLGHFETSGPQSIRTRYGMIYHNELPVAALVVRIVMLGEPNASADTTAPRRNGNYRALSRPSDVVMGLTSDTPPRSAMICGDYYAGGFHGVLLRDESALGRLWPAIATLLQRIEVQEGLSREHDFILIKDIPGSATSETRLLRHSQYRRVDSSPNMVLPLSPRWKQYEDYLAHLNVRYRLSAVRAARDLLRQGVVAQPLSDLAPWASRMHALYLSVQRRSITNFIPLPQGFLPALAAILNPEQFRCTALMKEGALIGFSFTIKDRDTALCYCLGWDTEVGQQSPMLPSLLHAVIRDALEMGCKQVNFGRTALRAKAQMGAQPEPSELWIYHARPELELPMVPLLDTLSHAPYGEQATPLPI